MDKAIQKYFIANSSPELSENFSRYWPNNSKIIYEVLRVIDGIPLFLKEHLSRLENSFNLKQVKYNDVNITIEKDIWQLIKLNNATVGNIKITYFIQEELLLLYFIPHQYPSTEQYNEGVTLKTYKYTRQDPNAKQLFSNYKESVEAFIKQNNIFEAVLINNEGFITEGSKSNLFFAFENRLFTAPGNVVLKGITREKVFEICRTKNISVTESFMHEEDLQKMQAAFITGTSPKILPVNAINNYKFDVRQPLLLNIASAYNQMIADYINLNKADN